MSRTSPADGVRHLRLQPLIRDELQALFRDDVDDPQLIDLQITALVLSADLRSARVHCALATSAPHKAAAALRRATPYLRANLAHALGLKRVPDLRFVLDTTFSPAEAP